MTVRERIRLWFLDAEQGWWDVAEQHAADAARWAELDEWDECDRSMDAQNWALDKADRARERADSN